MQLSGHARTERAIAAIALVLATIGMFLVGNTRSAAPPGDLPSLLGIAPDADGNTVLAALAAAAASSSGMYIKFDGVDGESKDQAHGGWSDLQSFAWGAHRSAGNGRSGATRTRGETTLGDVVVVRELDKSSTKMQSSVSSGTPLPKATIDFTTTFSDVPEVYYQWILTDVIVTSVQITGEVGGPLLEEISLNYAEIRVIYSEFDAAGRKKGNVEYSWKVEEGTA